MFDNDGEPLSGNWVSTGCNATADEGSAADGPANGGGEKCSNEVRDP